MDILQKTEYDDCTNNTQITDENDIVVVLTQTLLLSIPGGLALLSLISLLIWTLIKPLLKDK